MSEEHNRDPWRDLGLGSVLGHGISPSNTLKGGLSATITGGVVGGLASGTMAGAMAGGAAGLGLTVIIGLTRELINLGKTLAAETRAMVGYFSNVSPSYRMMGESMDKTQAQSVRKWAEQLKPEAQRQTAWANQFNEQWEETKRRFHEAVVAPIKGEFRKLLETGAQVAVGVAQTAVDAKNALEERLKQRWLKENPGKTSSDWDRLNNNWGETVDALSARAIRRQETEYSLGLPNRQLLEKSVFGKEIVAAHAGKLGNLKKGTPAVPPKPLTHDDKGHKTKDGTPPDRVSDGGNRSRPSGGSRVEIAQNEAWKEAMENNLSKISDMVNDGTVESLFDAWRIGNLTEMM
jgi:hypothetical protein